MQIATVTDADTTPDIPTASAEPPEPGGASPLRRCIATRAVRPKAELVRFVVGPDGMIVPDVGGRLPGRGLWVVADRDALTLACRRNLFAKAARATVRVPDGLVDEVAAQMARRCLETLGLARRAGRAVAGLEKVRDQLLKGRVGLLLAASDGSPAGRAKLQSAARGIPTSLLLTAAELGACFGREHVIHVSVATGRFTDRMQAELNRLAGFRPAGDGK